MYNVIEGPYNYSSTHVYLCMQAGGGAETALGRKIDTDGEICSEEVQTLQSC